MAIALTGSSGLIGSALLRRLAGRDGIRRIGRREPAELIADISDPESVARLDLGGCHALIHCAGIVDEDFAEPDRAFRQATSGMAALVGRAKAGGVRRFVYISSAHVYGPLNGPIDERSPPNPLHDYAIAHFTSEQILRRAVGEDFRGLVLRPCAVFGIPPDISRFQRWGLVPFGFPKAAIREGAIKLASHGDQHRNFVGAGDVADATAIWLDDPDPAPFTAANPIGRQSMSIFAFAQLCADIAEKISGRPCPVTGSSCRDKENILIYTTIDRRWIGTADLSKQVEQLMRLLLQLRQT